MPVGSTVWMKFEAGVCPDEDLDDCAGSNLPGVAPPNGIPTHTRSNANGSATGYAEILPDRVRTYIVSNIGAVMNASFQDTYTVGGTAAGPFDITFQLRVTGVMNTVPVATFNQLVAGNVQARIGIFNPDPLFNDNNRVAAFNPGADASTGAQSLFALGSVPVDITATYTKTGVNVGDVFDIGYQVRSAFSRGELDLLNAGAISFIVPEGVSLSSTMAQACGDGIDNDGDLLVDFPADPGCAAATGAVEDPECDDFQDNDADGQIDFPDDPDCVSSADPIELPEPTGALPELVGSGALWLMRRRSWLRSWSSSRRRL